ncbi:hypothetical protein M406DRAFT_339581 [Cryphonectria parasitica EP155]|uniref:DUF974 domain-containing protein n=1 Tax=Cryphonectria parasitica (strain ATCC 38755 / EP155) TaxID=660469 RepID=A0A9P4Y560_CRYP1|nr:uncharacterized protein M406DRAFT_339581 [Cryphonectria parasitica EP155]KAF3766335.1 hypothetical protein M406DRAFT_339581 [Cryphonectria parasitica EP155]
MSHQRYPSHDPLKEPHSISLKVLRLSRPSLVTQHPLPPTAKPSNQAYHHQSPPNPVPASLAYTTKTTTHQPDTNPTPFLLSPVLNLPPSFGSAYVGETFSCTLCANHETDPDALPPSSSAPASRKSIRDVRIEAEMKTPSSSSGGAGIKLPLFPPPSSSSAGAHESEGAGTDLDPGRTLQRIVHFDLKDEGNHVLGVTVSYYEATETSGRTRTFRKLYQFVCKPSLIVRTKAGPLPALRQQQPTPPPDNDDNEDEEEEEKKKEAAVAAAAAAAAVASRRRWVLEAQLENCSEDTMQLERVVLELEPGLRYRDCNWEASGAPKPVLHPSEVEQVCFVIEEEDEEDEEGGRQAVREEEGRILFGTLGIGWRGEMGSRGWLATGKLGTRHL